MNLFIKRTAPALALLGLALTSCQPDITDPKPSAGSADFSRYIAVGNSLTAGYSDNGLYLEGQQNSYPSILAGQFAQVGGGAFVQPLFPTANAAGSGYLKLAGFSGANPVITSEDGSFTAPATVVSGTPTGSFAAGRAYGSAASPLLVRYTGTDNQNLGVPGIRIADVNTADYGRLTSTSNASNFNPYFERLLSGAASTTYLGYVQERVNTIKPTFFTNWLGNNDVLGFASSGGTAAPLTSVATFSAAYNQVIDALTANGAKGLVATIPNVASTPYFTTVPAATYAGVAATPIPAALSAGIAAQLGLTALPAGSRLGLFITATTTTPGTTVVREATASDILLLPASSVINTTVAPNPLPRGIGVIVPGIPASAQASLINPLANSLVLDNLEAAAVQTRTGELNAVIIAAAQRKNLAVFDANTYFNGIARAGLVLNTTNNNASFVTGNLFSLDGVHPTPRGYAVVANEMIRNINSYYGSAVPGVDASQYRGVRFPQ